MMEHNTFERIAESVHEEKMVVLPPVYGLNCSFEKISRLVKEVNKIKVPMPTEHQELMNRLMWEHDISTAVLEAMDKMHTIAEMLQEFIDKAKQPNKSE